MKSSKQKRRIIVGDIHGELDGCREILRNAGLIDIKDNWTGDNIYIGYGGARVYIEITPKGLIATAQQISFEMDNDTALCPMIPRAKQGWKFYETNKRYEIGKHFSSTSSGSQRTSCPNRNLG